MMRERQILALLLVAALAGCGRDAEPENETTAADAMMVEDAETTADLLSPLRAGGVALVEVTQVHAGRTEREDVRQFGHTVAADHRALVDVLDSFAAQRGATLYETSNAREVANAVRMAHTGLENVPGEDANLGFIRAQVESHRRLLDTMERDAAFAVSAEMQTLLGDARAMVEAHLTRARQILGDLLGEPVEPPPGASQSPPQQPAPRPQPETPPPAATPPDTLLQG
jgi:predicted outer membrane protein